MGAIRLRHPIERDVNFTVVHHRRYRTPLACQVCGEIHVFKTYHLRLDSQGECVVSDVIWERLAELEGLPLRKVGTEAHPRPQVIRPPMAGTQPENVRERTTLFVPRSMRDAVETANQILETVRGS